MYALIAKKAGYADRNAEFYEYLKTYLESAANGADHLLWNGYTTINNKQERIMLVADECWTMKDTCCPQLREFLKNVEKSAKNTMAALLWENDFLDPEVKFYEQAIKVRFEFSDKRLEMFGKGGGR